MDFGDPRLVLGLALVAGIGIGVLVGYGIGREERGGGLGSTLRVLVGRGSDALARRRAA